MAQFQAYNGAMVTTAALTPVTTGTAIKTMLQLATPSTREARIVSWGFTFSSAPTAIVACELIQTDVAATVAAHVAAGVQPIDRVAGTPASIMTLGTAATGYTASAEGTITATKTFDQYDCPIGVSSYKWEWSLGREPVVAVSKFLRIRMTTATAVSAKCWICWDE